VKKNPKLIFFLMVMTVTLLALALRWTVADNRPVSKSSVAASNPRQGSLTEWPWLCWGSFAPNPVKGEDFAHPPWSYEIITEVFKGGPQFDYQDNYQKEFKNWIYDHYHERLPRGKNNVTLCQSFDTKANAEAANKNRANGKWPKGTKVEIVHWVPQQEVGR
jgi:hypothetical protein